MAAHRVRMLGTAALDLAWVAEGRLDASITLGNKPWDTAAGVLLAREAGATVVDTDGTAHGFHSAATIAAADPLISQLLPLIQATDANTLYGQRGIHLPVRGAGRHPQQCPLPALRLRRASLRPDRSDARRHGRTAAQARARPGHRGTSGQR
jgi:hypothetical protein